MAYGLPTSTAKGKQNIIAPKSKSKYPQEQKEQTYVTPYTTEDTKSRQQGTDEGREKQMHGGI